MVNILVASTQYPHNGGAATLAYELHNYLQNNKNICSKCCFFLNKKEDKLINNNITLLNPNNYGNIYKTNNIIKDIKLLDDIDCILAINYGIVPKIKEIYKKKIIYIVVGSPELTLGSECPNAKNISFNKFINDKEYDLTHMLSTKNHKINLDSIKNSTFTIINSPNTRKIYERLFPNYIHKFKNFYTFESFVFIKKYNLTNNISYNNHNKEFDLITISSSWTRTVKNPKLVFNIFNKYKNLKKIIIGNNIDKTGYSFNNTENTKIMTGLSNNLIIDYLSKSKILLLPSYYEAGGIIILEALKSGCKVITSTNVGLHYLLPEKYLCNDVYDINEWVNNINNILSVDEINYNIPSYEKINLATDVFELF